MNQFEPPSTPPLSKPAVVPRKKPIYKRKVFIAFVVLSALWLIGTLVPEETATKTQSENKSNSVTPPTTKKVILPWYPEGFNEYDGDPQIAWRWLDTSEFSCSYGDQCWGMMVIAREGCPSSAYVEITIIDNNGTNIGFTNDTTSSLGAGQKAKLVFEDFTTGAESARLAKISCY
jgi:hypothetical protein